MIRKYLNCLFINKNNFKCSKCNTIFKNKNDFNKHLDDERLKILKLELQKIYEKNINENNIYLFDKNTLGEHIYKENNGGNIYIIQNDLNMIEYYKIGITTNLIKRISNYRCGCVIEPKLHYYFPVKNIKLVDNTLKIKLKKFLVKREIYKINKLDEIIIIINNIQKDFDSHILIYTPEIKI